MQALNTMPVSDLKGIGSKLADKLAGFGIKTVQDALFHLPLRYEDRTRVYAINDVQPGQSATVIGEVKTSNISYGKKRMLVVTIADQFGSLTLRFFYFSAAQAKQFVDGTTVRCFGEIRRGNRGLEIIHPEYRIIDESCQQSVEDTYTPVYPTTEGIKQLTLRKLTDQALALLTKGRMTELLPDGLYQSQMSLSAALQIVHRPTPDIAIIDLLEGQHPAQQRLVIEELLAHQLSVLKVRVQTRQDSARAMTKSNKLSSVFLDNLPFKPTAAQNRVTNDILQDMQQPIPMMRLVQGDVGSGKTLVAALAALPVIEQGHQVALMAPTELLAEQHFQNFQSWFEPLGIHCCWLAGKLKGRSRDETLAKIQQGDAQLVVGTHALFQKQVEFADLALVIVDEQHRFGVHQRLSLREKGEQQGFAPHQLIMTATPIPRTLAMTAYADLDTSVIDELPPGRTPVKTVVLPDGRRGDVIERIRTVCQQDKRQVYWVCTLIEESESLQCQAAEDTLIILSTALPELRIGLVHGRLKAAEKQAIMNEFKKGDLDLLVATTVIEVGVDVPNASLMIIENAERLGLAQLHQLRGRVGRGGVESHCVLMYQHPLSKTAQQRLGVLRESNDGFVIAQKDLEIRGPGELLGTKQTGLADMKIADLTRDAYLVPEVQKLAQQLWQQYPERAEAIINRWLAYREQYGHA
ncbi:MAG: ATP-dependent DNA helicase RecG [Aestuariibacter sp.]